MDKNVFIFHGSFSSSSENWFPWLTEKLESEGYEVIAPDMPFGKKQSLESWLEEFGKNRDKMSRDSIVIGHSISPAFICQLVVKLNLKINSAYMVSGFWGLIGKEETKEYDEVNKTFFEEIDFDNVKKRINKIVCFYGDNDPYLSQDMLKDFADKVGNEIVVIEEGGHLNSESGYTSFNELFDYIKGSRQNNLPILTRL